MNKLLLFTLSLVFLSGCKLLREGGGGGGAVISPNITAEAPRVEWRSATGISEATLTEVETEATDTVVTYDSLPPPYIGKWRGYPEVTWEYHGFPMLDGTYTLDLEFGKEGYARATTDPDELEDIAIVFLWEALRNDVKNVTWDLNRMLAGELSTTAAHWNPTDDPRIYLLTFDVRVDKAPETYPIEFLDDDTFRLTWDEDGQEDYVDMFRVE